MEREQFRVLYRQFLLRMADVEALSAHAQGDSNRLAGQFATLLILVSLGLAFPALAPVRDTGAFRLGFTVASEHFLIAVTMLTVGLFAVLCWDTMFPDQRDVLTLGPLPVRARTLFLAKAAAIATALGLVVGVLNVATGLLWPANFAGATRPAAVPSFTFDPAIPPVSAEQMQPLLTSELDLPREPGQGIAVGVIRDGVRRTWTYGVVRNDTLFEIASISKTFTGLLLARQVAEGRVHLNDPVRGADFTLLELATHRSGLPGMVDHLHPADPENPFADYDETALRDWMRRQSVPPREKRQMAYSNAGFAVLGSELAARAGIPYETLLADGVFAPLGMLDSTVHLSPSQQARLAQGWFDDKPARHWELNALAPAGGILSNIEDMLTYAAAWLDPDRLGEPGRLARMVRADAPAGRQIALAWIYEPKTGTYWHNGATRGYTSHLFFCPAGRYAGVVLANHGLRAAASTDAIAEHIRQRFAGEPAVSLRTVIVPGATGMRSYFRWFAAYWVTMIAAGGFIFCCVLAMQGLAAQLLPRRLFLRASGWLQISTFCFLLGGAILEPKFPTYDALMSAEGQRVFIWSPAYWFLGVFHSMNGMTHPALTRLGHAAWTAFAVAVAIAAISYALAYVRTLRQIVESPEIAPSAGGLHWLPRFGGPLSTAVAQFSIRTLMRSRQHRLILAFYLGISFALTVVVLQSPEGGKEPLFFASIVTMGFAVTGMRVVFSLPLDLRANWMFQITPVPGAPAVLRARRRALVALAVAPIWTLSAVLCFWMLPWRIAAAHAVILGLLGLVAAEFALLGPVKIPFTCSYLPGRSNIHVMFVMCIFGIEMLVAKAAELEVQALNHSWGLAAIAAPLALVLIALRWSKNPLELRFEEEPVDAVLQLRLGPA